MEIFKEFGVSWILLLAQIVNFAILLLLLKRFLYKPVLKVLEERKAKVAQSLKNAEEIETRLQKIAQQEEEIMDKAKIEASKLLSEAKSEAKELTEKSLAETKESISVMLKKNEARLILEKDAMMDSAKKELTVLVATATERVAKKVMTDKDNTRLVDETIKELTKV